MFFTGILGKKKLVIDYFNEPKFTFSYDFSQVCVRLITDSLNTLFKLEFI